jgi:hypothetical protein
MNGKIDKVFKATVTRYTDEDFDIVYPHKWYKNSHLNKRANDTINTFINGKNVDIMRLIA